MVGVKLEGSTSLVALKYVLDHAVAEGSVVLTAEQEEVARRLGPGARDRMIKGVLEQQQYDDFEVKE